MSATLKPGPSTARLSFFFTAGPTTFIASSMSLPLLGSAGYRVIVPYVRGYGPTRFLSSETFGMASLRRSLSIQSLSWMLSRSRRRSSRVLTGERERPTLSRRCGRNAARRMVSVSGYLIGSQESGKVPLPPKAELEWWYQYYFATDRGRAGYDKYRHDFAKLIWQLASPKWKFTDAAFDRSAASFDNPDHVSIVIHNYRWRLGLAQGESKYDDLEKRLAESPAITVPTITLEGDANGAPHPEPSAYAKKFSGKYSHGLSKAASGIICLRKPLRPSLKLWSTSTVIDRR